MVETSEDKDGLLRLPIYLSIRSLISQASFINGTLVPIPMAQGYHLEGGWVSADLAPDD